MHHVHPRWMETYKRGICKQKGKKAAKQNKAESPPCLHHTACDTLLTGAFEKVQGSQPVGAKP